MLRGNWAVDDSGTDILLNGTSTGVQNTGGFSKFTAFTLSSGFKDGLNTLDFVVYNGGAEVNPTGFRVADLRAGGLPPGSNVPVSLTTSLRLGQVIVSWPTSATNYKLFTAGSLSNPAWTQITTGIVVSGDQNVYQTPATQAASFFRLQQ